MVSVRVIIITFCINPPPPPPYNKGSTDILASSVYTLLSIGPYINI